MAGPSRPAGARRRGLTHPGHGDGGGRGGVPCRRTRVVPRRSAALPGPTRPWSRTPRLLPGARNRRTPRGIATGPTRGCRATGISGNTGIGPTPGRFGARDLLPVPGLLSLARLPLAAAFPLVVSRPPAACAVPAAAACTDVLDGWWARRFGQVTATGAALDPLTDRTFAAALHWRGGLASPPAVASPVSGVRGCRRCVPPDPEMVP